MCFAKFLGESFAHHKPVYIAYFKFTNQLHHSGYLSQLTYPTSTGLTRLRIKLGTILMYTRVAPSLSFPVVARSLSSFLFTAGRSSFLLLSQTVRLVYTYKIRTVTEGRGFIRSSILDCGMKFLSRPGQYVLKRTYSTIFKMVLEAVCRDVASGADRLLDIGLQVVESSSLVSVLFREVFSHPYIFFHLFANGFE